MPRQALWLSIALVLSLCAPPVAQADTDTDAALQVLRELTELHVRQSAVACVSHDLLQKVAPPRPGEETVGLARIRGKALYLDRQLICAPLAAYYRVQGPKPITDRVLYGLETVAVTYGYTLGLRRHYAAECYGVHVVWKWVRRSEPGYAAAVRARRYLLENSYRPADAKLKPSCTLSSP